MIKRDSQNHKPSLIFTDFIDGFEKTKRLCVQKIRLLYTFRHILDKDLPRSNHI